MSLISIVGISCPTFDSSLNGEDESKCGQKKRLSLYYIKYAAAAIAAAVFLADAAHGSE